MIWGNWRKGNWPGYYSTLDAQNPTMQITFHSIGASGYHPPTTIVQPSSHYPNVTTLSLCAGKGLQIPPTKYIDNPQHMKPRLQSLPQPIIIKLWTLCLLRLNLQNARSRGLPEQAWAMSLGHLVAQIASMRGVSIVLQVLSASGVWEGVGVLLLGWRNQHGDGCWDEASRMARM